MFTNAIRLTPLEYIYLPKGNNVAAGRATGQHENYEF